MSSLGARWAAAAAAAMAAVGWPPGSLPAQQGAESCILEFRRIEAGSIAQAGTPIPVAAVRVFAYEGQPCAARVTAEHIAVDYGDSGVIFGRKTGQFVRRLTVTGGWPEKRPEDFPPPRSGYAGTMVGPGVWDGPYRDRPARTEGTQPAEPLDVAASCRFAGATWKAMQPGGFLRSLPQRTGHDYKKLREVYGSWTGILRELNELCYLQAEGDGGTPPARYTMKDGLASNIVTHLAEADGKLYAACVDIWDPQRKDWGPGGLCVFDAASRRWSRVAEIAGRPVRWVTLLQNADGQLWAGFLEGSGVEGDTVAYGMGLYPGHYGPRAKALVLVCLAGGRWRTFSRKPLAEGGAAQPGAAGSRVPRSAPMASSSPAAPSLSTETPRRLALVGGRVMLFSETHEHGTGNWHVRMAGHISMLDPSTGAWRTFDAGKDLGAYGITDRHAEAGEVVAFTDRGAHRWLDGEGKWVFLDPLSPLVNPALYAAAVVGQELWIGYTNQGFGVVGRQGISRYHELTGQWSYTSPQEIGTACPVRTITPLADGTVWILFAPRPWIGAAMEFPMYPTEPRDTPSGLGRYADGKWQFPARLEGVPESRRRMQKGPNGMETWDEPLPVHQLAAAGGRLFIANAAGVYVGPGTWKAVLTLPADGTRWRPSLYIRPVEGGRKLEVTNIDAGRDPNGQERWERGVCDPATGKLAMAPCRPGSDERWQVEGGGGLLSFGGRHEWLQTWVRIPTVKAGDWAVGPLDSEYHAAIETPWAVWLASAGQLIRLDREALKEWLGGGR